MPARSTASGCTGGFIVGPMVDAMVEANADGRYDLSTFRGRRGNPVFDAWVQPRHRRRGAGTPGGYGQTEIDGDGDVQPARAGRASDRTAGRRRSSTCGSSTPDDDERRRRASRRDRRARCDGHVRLLEPARAQRGAVPRRLAPHERPRPVRGRRHVHLRRARRRACSSPAAENIYPVEVENCVKPHPAVADCAVIGVPDADVGAVGEGDRRARRRRAGRRPTRSSSTAGNAWRRTRSRGSSSSSTRCRAAAGAVDYDALDAHFGGGGYPGGRTRSV